MEGGKWRGNRLNFKIDLYQQGFLDSRQFEQIEKLQDPSCPAFVEELLTLFFEDSERILNELDKELNNLLLPTVDFSKLASTVHQLKGSSSSIGVVKVTNACIDFRSVCEARNVEMCRSYLQKVKHEYFHIKEKLRELLQLQ